MGPKGKASLHESPQAIAGFRTTLITWTVSLMLHSRHMSVSVIRQLNRVV